MHASRLARLPLATSLLLFASAIGLAACMTTDPYAAAPDIPPGRSRP